MAQTQQRCLHYLGWFGVIAGVLLSAYPTVARAQIAADGTLGTQVNGNFTAPCTGHRHK